MCGISGLVTPPGVGTDKAVVRRMMDRLAHRGPDDTGTYDDGTCALGHTRLSIIDRSGGHEPILDDLGRATIYNGEIYNHEALRAELEADGVAFHTRSDAEVPMRHLIAAGVFGAARNGARTQALDHGTMMTRAAPVLNRLDGMFAFVVWDPRSRCLFAARDAYGIKPFFWTLRRHDGAFLFASEMKALLADDDVPAELDPLAVVEKAAFEYLLPGTTWLRDVFELAPGHALIHDASDGTTTIRRWFKEHAAPVHQDADTIATRLHALLVDAVEKRLMSERPLGVILSGGLDSSLIAALDRDLDPDRAVATFCISDDENNVDFQAARLVADALGTDHKEWLFGRDDFDANLARTIWNTEDIDHSTFFFDPLFRAMGAHATVGLCGQGADEAFGGYDRFRDIPATRRTIRERLARAGPGHDGHYTDVLNDHYTDLRSLLRWERGPQLAQFQLRLVDRNSMAHGTEIRVPLLDKAVVSLAAGLDPEWLIDADGVEKKALRLAAARTSLPKQIVERRKLPAGRRTSPNVVGGFERDMASYWTDAKTAAHRYGPTLEDPALLTTLALFEEIFVHRRGAKPTDLAYNDLL